MQRWVSKEFWRGPIRGGEVHRKAKGKIERFFGFVQSAFIPELALSTSVNTLDDLNQALLAWIESLP